MRKISFKATGAAMIAAVTLTGMTAVPCYAGFTLHLSEGTAALQWKIRNWIPCLEEV